MTQNEFALHQAKQADIKGFLQVLAPFCLNESVPEDVKKMALDKVREIIPAISLEVKTSTVKPLSSLARA